MNEGEKIAATVIGGLLTFVSFMGLMNALWYQEAEQAFIFGVLSFTAGWLFRFASKSLDEEE